MSKRNRHRARALRAQAPLSVPTDKGDASSIPPSPPAAPNRIELPGLDRVAHHLDRLSTSLESQGTSHAAREAEVASLSAEAKNMTKSLRAVADYVQEQRKAGIVHFLKSWWTMGGVATILIALASATWAIESFLQRNQETVRMQAEATFNSAREHLASSQPAIQANALRSIHNLAFRQTVIEPSADRYFPGAFIMNRLRRRMEYPFMLQCRSLFHEFAIQERTTVSGQNNLVSSAILESGVAWQTREQALDSLTTITVQGSLLFKANLPGARAIGLVCDGINFGATDFGFANLSGGHFNDCGLNGAILRGTILNGCDFRGAVLTEANLQKADLSFAHCEGAFFRKADFTDATFKQTDLSRADFAGATLDRVKFSQATLSRTAFNGASLKGAVFSQTDVSTAEFDRADLDGADLTAAIGVTKVNWLSAVNVDKARIPAMNPRTQTQRKP